MILIQTMLRRIERGVIRYTEMSTRMRITMSLIQMEVSYQSIATVLHLTNPYPYVMYVCFVRIYASKQKRICKSNINLYNRNFLMHNIIQKN